jgi:hypothetical protein
MKRSEEITIYIYIYILTVRNHAGKKSEIVIVIVITGSLPTRFTFTLEAQRVIYTSCAVSPSTFHFITHLFCNSNPQKEKRTK